MSGSKGLTDLLICLQSVCSNICDEHIHELTLSNLF